MRKIGLGFFLLVFLVSCGNKKTKMDPFATITNLVDSAAHKADDVPQAEVEKGEWEHDYLFTQQSYYTLLFDDEDDLELVGDTALTSVQVEWILLENRMVKKYYFERTKGVWMLEAINLRQI